VTKNFNNKIWLGFALENPQTTNLGGGGFNNNFVVGAPGTDGYNGGVNVLGAGSLSAAANYSFNYTPDFVVKAAFEPGVGHYEVFGLIRSFRDRIYPAAALTNPPTPQCSVAVPTANTPPCTDVRIAGGIGANARWSLAQEHLVVGIHFLGGDGVGRYGSGALPDVTARPNGTLAPIRGYQALGTLEWHSPHWDLYANAGGEYAERTIYLSPTGAQMGYGRTTQSTANCLVEPNPAATSNGTKAGFSPASNTCPDTRNLLEGTFGFWYRFYHGPKGSVELGPQYSYLVLNTWRNATGGPHTVENMFFSSFRYYLP